MSASADTKERILDAAEGIMLAKSFHSVGLNEILSAVKVPKGSFYHYFDSKEQFGVELLRHYSRTHAETLRRFLESSELDPLERLRAFFSGAFARMAENRCQQFCLVAKLASEVAAFSEPMRGALAEGSKASRAAFEKVINEGQLRGVMRQDVKPAAAAALVQDLWQGAMHRSQIEKSAVPLREACEFLCTYLAAP